MQPWMPRAARAAKACASTLSCAGGARRRGCPPEAYRYSSASPKCGADRVLVLLARAAGGAHRADHGVAVHDRQAADLRRVAAVGGGGDGGAERVQLLHLLPLRGRRGTVGRGGPRLAERDLGGDPGRAVHPVQGDEVAGGVDDGERQLEALALGLGLAGGDQGGGVLEGDHGAGTSTVVVNRIASRAF